MARPTEYSEDMVYTALDYMENFKISYEDEIPTIAGLACALGVAKSTVYLWKDLYPEFSDALNRISTSQERHTVNGGISGKFNPTISKLILHNHGYTEKTEEAPSTQPIYIEIVNPYASDTAN